MKLFATTTSERASKSQGGNEHMLIVLTVEIDGERQEIASMGIANSHATNSYNFSCTLPSGEKLFNRIAKTKGEKQKGETR